MQVPFYLNERCRKKYTDNECRAVFLPDFNFTVKCLKIRSLLQVAVNLMYSVNSQNERYEQGIAVSP